MQPLTPKSLVVVLVVIGVVFGAMLYSSQSDYSENFSELGLVLLPQPQDIDLNELKTSGGDNFSRESLSGHWSLIFFGFTSSVSYTHMTLPTKA